MNQCSKCFEGPGSVKGLIVQCEGFRCTKQLHISCAHIVRINTNTVVYYCLNHFQAYQEAKPTTSNAPPKQTSFTNFSPHEDIPIDINVNKKRRNNKNLLNEQEASCESDQTNVNPPSERIKKSPKMASTPHEEKIEKSQTSIFSKLKSFIMGAEEVKNEVLENKEQENRAKKSFKEYKNPKIPFKTSVSAASQNVNKAKNCDLCGSKIMSQSHCCRHCFQVVHLSCIPQKVRWTIQPSTNQFTCVACRNKLEQNEKANEFYGSESSDDSHIKRNFSYERKRKFVHRKLFDNVPNNAGFPHQERAQHKKDLKFNRFPNERQVHNQMYVNRERPNDSSVENSPNRNIRVKPDQRPFKQARESFERNILDPNILASERIINNILPVVTDTQRSWRVFYQSFISSKHLFNDATNITRISNAIQCNEIKSIGGDNLFEPRYYEQTIEDINNRLDGTEQWAIELRRRIYTIERPENDDYEGILKAIDIVKNFYNLIYKEQKYEYLFDANLCVDIMGRMPKRVFNKLSSEKLKAARQREPFFISNIMPELENVLEDAKYKLDLYKIMQRNNNTKRKSERSNFIDNEDELCMQTNSSSVLKKRFSCWLHNNDSHNPNKCRTLWGMSGLEAQKLAVEHERCIVCGLYKHTNSICPNAKKLKCNLPNCNENHHSQFCAKRPKPIKKHTNKVDEIEAEEDAFFQEANNYAPEDSLNEEVNNRNNEVTSDEIDDETFYFRHSHLIQSQEDTMYIELNTQNANKFAMKVEKKRNFWKNTKSFCYYLALLIFNVITSLITIKVKSKNTVNTIHHSLKNDKLIKNENVSEFLKKRKSDRNQLPIVVTTIVTPHGNKYAAFLIDSGSTTSLINTKFANSLLSKGIRSSLTIKGINSKKIDNKSRIIQLELRRPDDENNATRVSFHTFDELDIREQHFIAKEYQNRYTYLKSLCLKDFSKPIGLIGIDNIKIFNWNVVNCRKMEPHFPLGLRTCIGDAIIGSDDQLNDIYEEGLKLNEDKNPFVTAVNSQKLSQSHNFTIQTNNSDENFINSGEEKIDLKDYEEEYLKLEELILLQNNYEFENDSRDNYFNFVAMEMLKSETIKLPNSSHYKAPILWKDRNSICMPTEASYKNALRRMFIVEKYGKSKNVYNEYEAEVKNLLINGYAVELSEEEISRYSRFSYYVPIFFIKPENKRRRIIFDFKAKVNGVSFNEHIIGGLNLLNRIDNILFDVKTEKYVVKGDIKEMFLQIKLYEDDCDSMRFIFRFEGENRIKHYKLKVLPFGCASSPTISQYVKNLIGEAVKENNPLVHEVLLYYTYMDDTIKSLANKNEAANMIVSLKSSLKEGGFCLLKLNSNNKELNSILKEKLKNENQEKLFTNESVERLLGYEFDFIADTIAIDFSITSLPENVKNNLEHPTKRNVLQVSNAIFDPLGLFGYVTAKMKIVYRRVCNSTLKWDDIIDEKLLQDWKICLNYYDDVKNIKLPRWNTPKPYDSLELLIFCDASKEMTCCVAYLKSTNSIDSTYHVSLLTSKTHTVNKRREYSIPELELEAANQAVKLFKYIKQTHRYTFNKVLIFSDSKITIDEIQRTKREKFSVYTENRIKFIKENTSINQWYWIPSELQVADLGTKIETIIENNSQNAWFIPKILNYHPNEWTKFHEKINASYNTVEFTDKTQTDINEEINTNTFKSFSQLIRITKLIFRYKYKRDTKLRELLKEKTEIDKNNSISNREKRYTLKEIDCKIDEINNFLNDANHWNELAETYWLRTAQENDKELKEIIALLKSGKSLAKNNKYKNLLPYLDIDGVLRIRTRIPEKLEKIYSFDYDKIRPILLPQNSGITQLIVLDIHRQQGHVLLKTTANQIRARFHIKQCESTIRKIIKDKCHYCRRFNGRAQKPIMGDIPIETFGCFESSFIKITADVFGPIEIKPSKFSKKLLKRWALVTMCLNTRATHIEILEDMTVTSHLKAFEITFAIRGVPKIIYTDLHPSFLATDKTLNEVFDLFNTKFQESGVIRKSIKWITKAAYMSWNQGVVERQIAEIKKLMKNFTRLLNMDQNLTDYELRYILVKIINVLNNSPITAFEDNKIIPQLTPAHFLMLRENTQSHPLTNIDSKDLSTTWSSIQKLLNSFWNEWLKSYFPKYLNRAKWTDKAKQLQIDSIVLTAEKGCTDSWRLGRIIEIDIGSNDQVRSVKIKLGKNKKIENFKKLKTREEILKEYKKETAQIVSRPAMLVIELNVQVFNMDKILQNHKHNINKKLDGKRRT